ncbi:hypothetical protein [Actinophytocola oryzae]|uniref:hypothetical protein n=1 Tax=Actinophytocola oryzae TaxID=502181 RepID=UPI001063A9B2|nr:hypothetical protein [Actinophytocola oryzae]
MSYPPQGHGPAGHQPYGPPPPGYPPYGYGRPSTALAYVTAILFVVCGALALTLAIVGWDGTSDSPTMLLGLVGAAFTDDLTGNVDFAISATMTAACTTITFALVLLARLEFVRWILAVVGALVTAYYVYAVIWVLSHDGGEYIAMVAVSLLLWLVATVLAVLPATGRAMRRKQSHGPPPSMGPPGYPPRY